MNTSPSYSLKKTVIVIGASTGGTEAIFNILKSLPAKLPPIVITQHMPEGFTDMYAKRMDAKCKLNIKEAENGEFLIPGTVYIAPGGNFHTEILITSSDKYKILLSNTDKVSGHKPSVDVLFFSASKAAKNNCIGIILTGMGADGAKGLLSIKEAGGYTIGQNKETCIVYGMPMEAKKIGAVNIEANLNFIPDLILSYLKNL